jgi:hypothetical protein
MSKVYSFRIDEDNPREAQAKGVIQTWVEEGYSLRYVIVEALLSYKKGDAGQEELNTIVEQLKDLISSLDKQPLDHITEGSLPNSFLEAVKQAARREEKL